MKSFRKIVLLTFIVAVFITCKKEQLAPSTVEGQPVFSFNGTIGSNNLSLKAGVNNYYMYSTYTQNSGVYSFTGTLKNTASNLNSIQIIINDDAISGTNSLSDINNSVAPANTYYYNIPGGNSISDAVTIKPLVYGGSPQAYTFNFGDGGDTSESSRSAVTHIYKKFQVWNTTLSAKFGATTVTITNPVNLIKESKAPLTINYIFSNLAGKLGTDTNKVSFSTHVSGGVSPYIYRWKFGDGGSDSSAQPLHVYIDSNSDRTYPCTLTVTDQKHTSITYNYVATDDPISPPRIDDSISSIPVPNPLALSNVTVNYTDGAGNLYTSNDSLQPYNSTFQITAVSEYQANMNNNPTKMLNVSFNCMLYPVSGGTPIAATNCTAIIAVAYY